MQFRSKFALQSKDYATQKKIMHLNIECDGLYRSSCFNWCLRSFDCIFHENGRLVRQQKKRHKEMQKYMECVESGQQIL